MRKSTVDALNVLEAWLKAYKRRKWIYNICYSFDDAYCQPNSPVSLSDAPEIERLQRKLDAWYDKAIAKHESLFDAAWEIRKRYRRNKTVMKRYEEISHYIAVAEGLIRE